MKPPPLTHIHTSIYQGRVEKKPPPLTHIHTSIYQGRVEKKPPPLTHIHTSVYQGRVEAPTPYTYTYQYISRPGRSPTPYTYTYQYISRPGRKEAPPLTHIHTSIYQGRVEKKPHPLHIYIPVYIKAG